MNGLAVHDITVSYGGTHVLGPLSLTAAPGEQVALVGRSGAGKSTLLSLLYDEAGSQGVYMPQDLGLVDTLSVFHNVFMGRLDQHATWYNLMNLIHPFKTPMAEITAILATLGLEDKVREPAGELSGGQRQRTAVGRALYHNGDILLADEPVSALDGPLAHRVMRALVAQYRTAVIALHDIELALAYTSRVVGIRDGEIALDEPSDRLSVSDLSPLY